MTTMHPNHSSWCERRLLHFRDGPPRNNDHQDSEQSERISFDPDTAEVNRRLCDRIRQFLQTVERHVRVIEDYQRANDIKDKRIVAHSKTIHALHDHLRTMDQRVESTSLTYKDELSILERETYAVLKEVFSTYKEQYMRQCGIILRTSKDNHVIGTYNGETIRATLSPLQQITHITLKQQDSTVSVTFKRPLDPAEFRTIMKGVTGAMEQLRSSPLSRSHLPNTVTLQDVGSGRFDTDVHIDGKRVKLCATNRDVLRVVQEAPEHMKELLKTTEKKLLKDKEASLRAQVSEQRAIQKKLIPLVFKRTLEDHEGNTVIEDMQNKFYVQREWQYPHHAPWKREVWSMGSIQSALHYSPGGTRTKEVLFSEGGEKIRSVEYLNSAGNTVLTKHFEEDGSYRQRDYRTGTYRFFDKNGQGVYGHEFAPYTLDISGHFLIDKEGKEFRTFADTNERRQREGLRPLTKGEFMEYAAQVLDTVEKKNHFVEHLWTYVHDSPNSKEDPYAIGTEEGHGQYTQMAYETVMRDFRGDCDDLAQFFLEINRLQGTAAFCITIGGAGPAERVKRDERGNVIDETQVGHAICVSIVPGTDGRTLRREGTYGVYEASGSTPEEALQALLRVYETEDWMQGWTFNPENIQCFYAPHTGEEREYTTTIDAFIDLPETHERALRHLCRELDGNLTLQSPYAQKLIANMNREIAKTVRAREKETGGTEWVHYMRKIYQRTNAELRPLGYSAAWDNRTKFALKIIDEREKTKKSSDILP